MKRLRISRGLRFPMVALLSTVVGLVWTGLAFADAGNPLPNTINVASTVDNGDAP